MDYTPKIILVIFLILSIDAKPHPQTFTGFEKANISGSSQNQQGETNTNSNVHNDDRQGTFSGANNSQGENINNTSVKDDREGPVHNGENSGTNNFGNNFNSPQVGEVGTMTGNI